MLIKQEIRKYCEKYEFLTRQDMQDIAQDVQLIIVRWKNKNRVMHDNYIFRIIKRVSDRYSVKRLREAKDHDSYVARLRKEDFMFYDKPVIDWSDFDFECLTERESKIVNFIYLGHRSFEWIAGRYGTTANNIYQIHHRILEKLKKSKYNRDTYEYMRESLN
jgi:hypothetical protein